MFSLCKVSRLGFLTSFLTSMLPDISFLSSLMWRVSLPLSFLKVSRLLSPALLFTSRSWNIVTDIILHSFLVRRVSFPFSTYSSASLTAGATFVMVRISCFGFLATVSRATFWNSCFGFLVGVSLTDSFATFRKSCFGFLVTLWMRPFLLRRAAVVTNWICKASPLFGREFWFQNLIVLLFTNTYGSAFAYLEFERVHCQWRACPSCWKRCTIIHTAFWDSSLESRERKTVLHTAFFGLTVLPVLFILSLSCACYNDHDVLAP